MLCVVQITLLVWDQLRVVHAAREGARALAVSNNERDAVDAALRAGSLDEKSSTVEVFPVDRPAGTPSRVRVVHRARILVPFTDALMPDLTLIGTAWMRVERDP